MDSGIVDLPREKPTRRISVAGSLDRVHLGPEEPPRVALLRGCDPSRGTYSPECVEEEFSEVHGSKRPIRRSAKHSTTAWRHPFGVKTLRLGSSSCTVVYQGVATRNDATTREILAYRTGTRPNFALTEF